MATNTRPTVVGVFDNRADAERAADQLHRAGFRDDQIGFAAQGGEAPAGGRTLAEGGTGEAGEGAAKGAIGGGILGGILGALATGLIPGIGPVIAGGLLVGILGGAAVGAAAGGLIGALTGAGVPEEEARYYDEEFRSGRTLVTVRADGRYDEAYAILQRAGAYDFETRGARTGAAATMTETARPPTGRTVRTDGEPKVELHEERLVPHKEMQETGEVELRKDVVERERTVDVPVSREEVVVERHPVEPRPTGQPIGEGETIEVPVREERVTLEKQPVVYEEVEIGKRQAQETERVSGTVRREEAHIEREGDVDVREGSGGASRMRTWAELSPSYQQRWEQTHPTGGMQWHDVEPYRRYGYEMSHDQRFQGRDWPAAESELRTGYRDWSRSHGYSSDESAWERFKDQVREAWEETRQTARGRR